ncbi:MAG TPA: heavy metal-responsive transcriptional regulator [Bryobacteraceae bacterium]|jgi:DNA-binding transcriptional MerR regulator|nr:heavy metal-responsive transcriptional regulator [Bryobacteraceae bacterium]
MRSGELARLTGVSTDTLRHYERLGALPRPGRTGSGYRVYPDSAVRRVELIRRSLAVGFSLKELVRVLRVRDGGGAPCRQVRALAQSKLEQIDRRLEELVALRRQLAELLATWDHRLEQTPPDQPAGLLEMLPGSLQLPSRKEIKR